MPAAERVVMVKATAEALAEAKSTLPLYVSITGQLSAKKDFAGDRAAEHGCGDRPENRRRW